MLGFMVSGLQGCRVLAFTGVRVFGLLGKGTISGLRTVGCWWFSVVGL